MPIISLPVVQKRSPFITYSVLPDYIIVICNHFFKLPIKIKAIYNLSEPSVGRFKINYIDNYCTVVCMFKIMFMLEVFKVTPDHFIYKHFIGLHLSYFKCKDPGFKKIFCFPGYRFVLINKPGNNSRNSFSPHFFHRHFMKTDAPAEVKYPFNRCSNKRGKMDRGHKSEDS